MTRSGFLFKTKTFVGAGRDRKKIANDYAKEEAFLNKKTSTFMLGILNNLQKSDYTEVNSEFLCLD